MERLSPDLARQLVDALEVIASPAGRELGPALDTIERIAREERPRLDTRLNHFLSGRSYGKALAWLKEHDTGRSG